MELAVELFNSIPRQIEEGLPYVSGGTFLEEVVFMLQDFADLPDVVFVEIVID